MYDEFYTYDKKIKQKKEALDELRTLVTSMTSKLGERVQTSPEDKLSNIMCKIIMIENELDLLEEDVKKQKDLAYAEIQKLDNKEWQDIVYLHYVELEPITEIARKKGKTAGSIYMKNNRAVKRLKKLLT